MKTRSCERLVVHDSSNYFKWDCIRWINVRTRKEYNFDFALMSGQIA